MSTLAVDKHELEAKMDFFATSGAGVIFLAVNDSELVDWLHATEDVAKIGGLFRSIGQAWRQKRFSSVSPADPVMVGSRTFFPLLAHKAHDARIEFLPNLVHFALTQVGMAVEPFYFLTAEARDQALETIRSHVNQ